MAKRFTVEVTDLEWKALAWKYVNPHQHIDDFVTNRIKESMDEIAALEIKRRLADPNWTEPIPADKTAIFDSLILKSALQLQKEDTERMLKFVADPDDPEAQKIPTNVSVKPSV
jgi:hypothetical protein